MDQIQQWIIEASVANGYPHMGKVISYSFSKRLKSSLGQAICDLGEYRIELSESCWALLSEKSKHDTVKHEACHVLSFYKYGQKGVGHNKFWKSCMVAAGLEPDRCHYVAFPTPKRPNKVYCTCRAYYVSNLVLGRIKAGKLYICKDCKSTLLENKVDI